ncbi:UDP-glucuronosyltransferase 1A1-like [Haliotis asinina]|uniref:UDP-glucuronosyltransferase 1A1-like n=1 Tax=Haliotis asinina TaxID=109174 RepID=UPI0035326A2C
MRFGAGGVALLLLLCLPGFHTARILLLFFPAYSHIRGSLNVATELASRGHVVWNALSTELANHKGMQSPGVNILKYESVDDYDMETEMVQKTIRGYFEENSAPLLTEQFRKLNDKILRDTKLFSRIANLKFDLIVFDSTPLPRMLTIIAYKLDIPFIFIGATLKPQITRTPFIPSATPQSLYPWTPRMDFWSRVTNAIVIMTYIYVYDPFSDYMAVATYAPDKPYITMESLAAKAWLWLIEQEPFMDYPSATLPNVKMVGSLTTKKPEPLSDKYGKFMNEAKDGVVIVSFGSNVKGIPDEIFRRLLESFSRTKYRFVFKSEKQVSVGPDILLTDWMPQSDLLAHPNTNLFITHCGANGQNEAFLQGVPMIGFPMFAEQPYNAKKLVYFGFGIEMDLKTFTVDDLVSNINEVIQNSSYSQKIKKAAEITKLRERSPKEEAVYWIEHVLKYGGAHLRSYCQDMPLYQYLCLDVIGLVLFILHFGIFVLWKSCSYMCNRCRIRHQPKPKRD